MKELWIALAEKGRIATVIGTLLIVPVNIMFAVKFYALLKTVGMDQIALTQGIDRLLLWAIIANLIAMMWYMLPSSLIFKAGSIINLEIKD